MSVDGDPATRMEALLAAIEGDRTERDFGRRLEDAEGLLRQLVASFREDRQANAETFTAVNTTLSRLLGEDEQLAPVTPVAWVDRATETMWVELADWVDWLAANYQINDGWAVRPCWPQHLGVAEELAALWSAWRQAALKDMMSGGDALAFWHDRYLAPTLARIPHLYATRACEHKHEHVAAPALTLRSHLPGDGEITAS